MKNEYLEVKEAVYIGMNIFNVLKNIVLKSDENFVSLEDKKYMSLYLGFLYSKNKISNCINELIDYKRIRYKKLSTEEYIKLYSDNFTNIFREIDFTSINSYFNFLVKQDSAIMINNILKIDIDEVINNSNKQLIKK